MRIREDRTDALYALSRDLSRSSYADELFKIALKHIQDFFQCRAVIFASDGHRKLSVRFGETENVALTANELAVAQWAYEHQQAAGKDTETLPGSKGIYIPFVGAEKTVGVLGIFPAEDKQFVNPDQLHMLEMFVNQTALAVEGAQLAAATLDAESRIANERLRNLLLTTFSSELPELLSSISRAASELLDPALINDGSKRTALLQKIRKEIEDLNTLIAELPGIIESQNPPV